VANFNPDNPSAVLGWWQGMAVVKFIEGYAQLGGVTDPLRSLLATHEPGTNGEDRAPAEASPLSLFMARMLGFNQRLAEGADPSEIDVAAAFETRKFLNFAGIPLPSDQCLRDLNDMQDGSPSKHLRRKQNQRPKLTRRQILVGNAAYLVETLVVGGAFSVEAAAEKVAEKLNTAGLRETSKGKLFKAPTIAKWHQDVMYHAKPGVDPAWDVFEMQRRVLKRLHPDYKQWGKARLLEWLADEIRKMARVRYFDLADRHKNAE
jgi:hypothetical protein